MDFKANRIYKILVSNCIVFVSVEILKHSVYLSISQWKSPVIQVEFKFVFVNTLVIVFVKITESFGGGFPLQPNFVDNLA